MKLILSDHNSATLLRKMPPGSLVTRTEPGFPPVTGTVHRRGNATILVQPPTAEGFFPTPNALLSRVGCSFEVVG